MIQHSEETNSTRTTLAPRRCCTNVSSAPAPARPRRCRPPRPRHPATHGRCHTNLNTRNKKHHLRSCRTMDKHELLTSNRTWSSKAGTPAWSQPTRDTLPGNASCSRLNNEHSQKAVMSNLFLKPFTKKNSSHGPSNHLTSISNTTATHTRDPRHLRSGRHRL